MRNNEGGTDWREYCTPIFWEGPQMKHNPHLVEFLGQHGFHPDHIETLTRTNKNGKPVTLYRAWYKEASTGRVLLLNDALTSTQILLGMPAESSRIYDYEQEELSEDEIEQLRLIGWV